MQSDMHKIKESIHDVQYQLQNAQNELHDTQIEVRHIKADIENIKKDLRKTNLDFSDLKDSVKKNTFTINSVINRCLTVLGSGYKATTEKLDKLNIETLIAENAANKVEIELMKTQIELLISKLTDSA